MGVKLLICGFGPFPGAPANPACAVVEQLQASGWTPSDAGASWSVLPTVWAEAPQAALDALTQSGADAMLLIGVEVSAEGFKIELVARNHADCLARDAQGAYAHGDPIDAEGPPKLGVTGPAEAMLEAVRAVDLPAGISTDAGAYICNYTLYRVLQTTIAPVGFVHVPQAHECDPHSAFYLADLCAGVKAAAEAFVKALERGPAPA
jgi:pyroglutamyl-peptidase